MPENPRDLFISYSSKDRPWAERLFADLKARFPTLKIAWDRDPASLPAGIDWREWIKDNAKNTTHLAVFWSQYAKDSDEVGPEIQAFCQNIDTNPNAASGAKRKVFYIPLEGRYGWLDPVQGFPELRHAYAPAAADRGISNLDASLHRDEWHRMVGIIGRAAEEAEATQAIALAVLVTTTKNLKYLDVVFDDPNLPRPTLQEYLGAVGLTLDDAKARYGDTAYSWRPFGTSRTIIDLMEDAREIAHRSLPKACRFHWKPSDFMESALTAGKIGPHAFQALVADLAKGPSVVVTDPISLFNPVVATMFNKLEEYAKKPHSVILSISPHEHSAAERLYASLFNNGMPLLKGHLHPDIPITEAFALCGINVQHVLDIERLVRGGLGYHMLQRMKAESKHLIAAGA